MRTIDILYFFRSSVKQINSKVMPSMDLKDKVNFLYRGEPGCNLVNFVPVSHFGVVEGTGHVIKTKNPP